MNHHEWHTGGAETRINWLRAAVLGANDGIVSVAAIVVGVAGASDSPLFVLTAGIAGLVAGALSMAAGEYVSVSAQRDTQEALLEKERRELRDEPEAELEELAAIYEAKGLSSETARVVAHELTEHDAFAAHVDAELRMDPHALTDPWHAALASAVSFLAGGIIPLVPVIILPTSIQVIGTFAAVLCALFITGAVSAHASGSSITRATVRVVLGGALAMAITFGVGKLFGVAIV